eukprot:scaffold73941_cov53-Phaeocystis_antarctica.AAC.1
MKAAGRERGSGGCIQPLLPDPCCSSGACARRARAQRLAAGRRPIEAQPRRTSPHAKLKEEEGDNQRKGVSVLSQREAEARKHLVLVLMQARVCMVHGAWCMVHGAWHARAGAAAAPRSTAAPACYTPL